MNSRTKATGGEIAMGYTILGLCFNQFDNWLVAIIVWFLFVFLAFSVGRYIDNWRVKHNV